MTRSRSFACSLLLACLAGCGSSEPRPADGSGDAGAPADVPAWPPQPAHVEAAIEPLAAAIAERYGPEKPLLQLGSVSNHSRRHVNTSDLKNLIYEELQERDVVRFASAAGALADVHRERDYRELGMQEEEADPPEPAADLLLTGELTDDVVVAGEIRTTTFRLTLRLASVAEGVDLRGSSHTWQETVEEE